MKCLFFDLEFATSKNGICKICEFGYVVTNEKFNVINRGNFIIDPYISRSEWDYWVVRKLLKRKIKEYESKPRFDEYYDEISDLFSNADYVFGHTVLSDVEALNQEIQRYQLNPINFSFYDVKEIYKQYSNIKKSKSVTNILSDLHVGGEDNAHDAETDAYNTMLILKNMINNLEIDLEGLLELVPNVKDSTKDFVIKSIDEKLKFRSKKFNDLLKSASESNDTRKGSNRRLFLQFIDSVKSIGKSNNTFQNQMVSISINYEEHHFKQILNLIQLITNNGGKYITKASKSDLFIKYDLLQEDGSFREDTKLNYVVEANNNGANIEIISFDELLRRLKITEQELDEMPLPLLDFSANQNNVPKVREKTFKIDDSCTLGKLFPDVFEEYLKRKDDK